MSGMDTYGPPAPDPEPEGNLGGGESFYPTVEQGPRFDQRAAKLYDSEIKARAAGNTGLADAYQNQQREIMVLGQGLGAAQGISPAAPLSTSSQSNPDLELYRQLYGYMERDQQFNQLFEQHNVAELGSYLETVLQDYKGQQDAPNIKQTENMSMDERVELMKRLEPVMRDPNEIAEIRQRLTQLDQAMKAVDPENRTISVFNHPRTARIAKWLARESTSTTAGYVADAPQKLELGDSGWKSFPITMAAAEGVTGFGMELLGGIVNGTGLAMDALTGGKVSWAGPTNYIEDQHGNLVFNGGKIPSVVSVIAGVNAQMLHSNVQDWLAKKDAVRGYIDRVQQARNWEHVQSSSFDKVVRGAAGVAGMGLGFGLPAGAAMRAGQGAANFGNLLTKGLLRMAEGGSSVRMVKLTKIMAETAGASVANGLLEMTAFGSADGLDKAFAHGMAMAPVLMAFGAMGRKAESVLSHPYMPKWMSRAVSGGIEGVGFGALEAAQTGALWHLMKDPSASTWEIYAKNMLGFAIFKAGFGRSVTNAPGFGEQASREMTRQAGRQALAEEVSKHDERQRGGSVLDELQGPPVPKVKRTEPGGKDFDWKPGSSKKMQVKGVQPSAERLMEQAGRGELQEPEMISNEQVSAQRTKKADTQGRDPLEDPSFENRPEGERRKIMKGGTAIERRKIAETFDGPERREGDRRTYEDMQDELLRIKAEGPTPKNRQRVLELLNETRGTVTEGGAKMAEQLRRQVELSDPQFKGERPEADVPISERRAVLRKETKADRAVRENLEARVKASGAPRRLLRELGDISRARRAARTSDEARELEARQRRLELELDALEMAQDPVMNATMREALAEEEFNQAEGKGPGPRLVEGKGPGPMFEAGPSRPIREGEVFPVKESKLPTRPIGTKPSDAGPAERRMATEGEGDEPGWLRMGRDTIRDQLRKAPFMRGDEIIPESRVDEVAEYLRQAGPRYERAEELAPEKNNPYYSDYHDHALAKKLGVNEEQMLSIWHKIRGPRKGLISEFESRMSMVPNGPLGERIALEWQHVLDNARGSAFDELKDNLDYEREVSRERGESEHYALLRVIKDIRDRAGLNNPPREERRMEEGERVFSEEEIQNRTTNSDVYRPAETGKNKRKDADAFLDVNDKYGDKAAANYRGEELIAKLAKLEQKHSPEMSPNEIDSLARSYLDTIVGHARGEPIYQSDIQHLVNELGARPQTMRDLLHHRYGYKKVADKWTEQFRLGEDEAWLSKMEAGPPERASFEDPRPDVDPEFGERYGPHSMRERANPHRQLEDIRKPGQESVRASEILDVLKGRSGFKGIRVFKQRVYGREPSAVQIAIRAGRVGGKRTLGVFKVFENLTRTKEGMDLVVAIHEWSHAMMRQVLFGDKRAEQQRKAETNMWQSMSPALQKEMRWILRSYPGSEKFAGADTLSEAWAEWHARNILGDPTLRSEVPELSMYFDAWLRNQPHLMEQYRAAKELTELYKNQGARERVSMLSRRKDPRVRKAVRRALKGDFVEQAVGKAEEVVWDSLVKGFFDDMHMLKKSQRKWMSLSDIDPRSLSILDDPARLHDALAMTASKQADSYIVRGRHNLGFKREGEGLKQIMDEVVKGFDRFDLKGKRQKRIDFIDYVVATRALELIAAGKNQTLPKSDFLQAHKELIAANPEFRGLADRMKLWSDGLLDLVAEAGNLAPKDLQLLKDFGTVYIPFIRAMEGTVESRFSRGVAEKGNAMRRMKGDKREILDPMEAMMETTRTMIVKAHQQMVMKALYKMTLIGDVGGLATRVKRSNVPAHYRVDQVWTRLRAKIIEGLELNGAEIEEIEGLDEGLGMLGDIIKEHNLSPQILTLFSQKAFPVGEGNVVAYTPRLTGAEIYALPKHRWGEAIRQNGKMQWLELDPNAFTALMGLDQPIGPTFMDNVWMRMLFKQPKEWVRFWATDANPMFVAANAIRDVMSAPVFSREGKFKPWDGITKFVSGAATVFATSRLAGKMGYEATEAQQEFMQMYDASGAKVSSIFDQGVRREMRGEVAGILNGAREVLQKSSESWKNWLGTPESFIRISEFKRVYKEAIAAGKGEVEAGLEALEAAKEATVNFARAGTVARGVNQMVPYFSASFAGQRLMLRSLAGMEGKTDAERGSRSAMAMMNAAVAITAPTMLAWLIHHEEDWYRDLPEWRKRHFINTRIMGQIISIPLPFELGVVAGSLPMAAMDAMTDSNPIAIMPTIGSALFPYISGLGGFIPPAAKAALEVATGQDLYQMRELTPYWMSQSKAPEDQMRRGTAQAFRGLFSSMPEGFQSMGINNPIELQQAVGTLTAGGIPTIVNLMEDLFGMKDHPGIQPSTGEVFSHFVNRFTRQSAHGGSRSVNDFYRQFDEAEDQAKRPKATPNDRVRLSQMRSEREAMADVRRRMASGQLTREEGDRRLFEIANKRTGMVK